MISKFRFSNQFFAPCGIDFRCQRQFTWCSFALPLIWAYLQSGRTLCFQKNRLFLEKTYKNLIFENFRTRFLENQWTDFYSEYSFDHTLTLKTIGCEIKCQFFHFLLREIEIWLQNQINRIISCIKPTFFLSGYGVFEKIKISHHLANITIFGLLPVFRALPVTGHVWNYPQYTHQTFSYHMQKTVWFYLKSVARKVVLRFWHSKKKATLLFLF